MNIARSFYLVSCSALLGVLILVVAHDLSSAGTQQNLNSVKHIVAIQYKSSATDKQVEDATRAFMGLVEALPYVKYFSHGKNFSHEGEGSEFTHIYELQFQDKRDLTKYSNDPLHTRFAKYVGEELDIVERALVLDYVDENN